MQIVLASTAWLGRAFHARRSSPMDEQPGMLRSHVPHASMHRESALSAISYVVENGVSTYMRWKSRRGCVSF